MKKLLICIIALLLCTLPALADFGFQEEGLPDGRTVLHFENLELTLPAGWEDKVLMIDGEDGLSFYQAVSYEKYLEAGIKGGGYLFTMNASQDADFLELPAFSYLGFSEKTSMYYYLVLPSDYPAWTDDDGIRAEYDEMLAQVGAIADSAVILGNLILEDGNDLEDGVVVLDGNGLAEEPENAAGEYEASGTGTITTDAEENEAEAAQGGITLEQIRYHFEHSALPRFFYEDPSTVLSSLGDVGAFPVFAALANENGVTYPYTADDFTQDLYTADDGTVILQIIMPLPEVTTQCYRIYLVNNSESRIASYYTVEYDNMLGDAAFLCGWTVDMNHVNYGGMAILDPADNNYEEQLDTEAEQVYELAVASSAERDEPLDDTDETDETLEGKSSDSDLVIMPKEVTWDGSLDGDYCFGVKDLDHLEDGYFTMSLYAEDMYDLEVIEDLKLGDRIHVWEETYTVGYIRIHGWYDSDDDGEADHSGTFAKYPSYELASSRELVDDGELSEAPASFEPSAYELIMLEDFPGYIFFEPVSDTECRSVVNDWTPCEYLGDVTIRLPLPDDFIFLNYADDEGDDETFLGDVSESWYLPYNSRAWFKNGQLIQVRHSDYPYGPEDEI